MTTLTPHPILPGTVVLFPAWLYFSRSKRWLFVESWTSSLHPWAHYCTHYLNASIDADPATFPRPGEEVPTPSAQEAAERAANGPTLTKAHALTADRIMTLITENLAAVPTTVEAISEMLHDPALSEAVALEIEEHEHRQPPAQSPGSGEALRGQIHTSLSCRRGRTLTLEVIDSIKAELATWTEALAQPATPPLPSGDNSVDKVERIIADGITNGDHPKTIAMKLVSPAPQREELRTLTPQGIIDWAKFSEESLAKDPRKIRSAPPVPSGDETRDALAVALTAVERSLEDAPGFDGYFRYHREAVAKIRALGIAPIKQESNGL